MLPEGFNNSFGNRERALTEAKLIYFPALANKLIASFINGQRGRRSQAPDVQIEVDGKGLLLMVRHNKLINERI